MPQIRYRGDRTGGYVHAVGTGLVGKVVGPTHAGAWFVITEASYDADTDTTFATAEQLRRPEDVLNEAGS